MTGPEHYTEAERLLSNLNDAQAKAELLGLSGEALVAVMAHLTAEAQVHATLALVAATVEASFTEIDVRRPTTADPDLNEPAYPGTPWGRALYGVPS